MTGTGDLRAVLDTQGFVLVPDALSPAQVAPLAEAVDSALASATAYRRGGSAYALRGLLDVVPEIARLAYSSRLRAPVEAILGPNAVVVRSLLFDKTPDANWKVPWHQDRTIAVRERREADGFGPWSVKAGVTHVQPPAALLERMLTLRLHLDPCDESNGPLRVLPGSHRGGFLSPGQIRAWRERGDAPKSCCSARSGDILLMRPLLLHASSPAERPGRRRVVHLEWAAGDLPEGLEWHEARRDRDVRE